jgi:hypothetical protein
MKTYGGVGIRLRSVVSFTLLPLHPLGKSPFPLDRRLGGPQKNVFLNYFVGFEIFTAIAVISSIFWNVMEWNV